MRDQLLAKLADLDKRLADFDAQRAFLMEDKMTIQTELSQIKYAIRGRGYVPNYHELTGRQVKLLEQLNETEVAFQKNNHARRVIIDQQYITKLELKQQGKEEHVSTAIVSLPQVPDVLVSGLLSLHSKYEAFAKDATRINSMRLLAAEVASDLHALIRKGSAYAGEL